MQKLLTSIAARDGLAATHELYSDGHTRSDLATAVRRGTVLRVRQGWYSARGLHPTLLAIARIGGAATCLSGLRLHGFWTHPHSDVHVSVRPHASWLRTPRDSRRRLSEVPRPGVRVHWREASVTSRLLLGPLDCLVDLLQCQPREVILASADSVLRQQPELRSRWRAFVDSVPATSRAMLLRCDGVCESGTETITWDRLRHWNLPLRRQATIPGIGRVDFLVGDRLVLEIDGLEYHVDPQRFESDRHRDARLSARGYRVLRFSYKQVLERWSDVEAAVLAAVLRGDHR